jgi:hypothetical protein
MSSDWWNDPPDYPEPPECCDDAMEVFDDGVCLCSHCGLRIDTCVPDWDPGPEPIVELPDDFWDGPEHCPHGKLWGDCDACDHLSDLAYDAARERR